MWKLFQTAIICAVVESDYLWHWSPPHSLLAPVGGVALAALVTCFYSDIKAGRLWADYRDNRRKDLLALVALIQALRNPRGLLRRNHRSQ
jgi:hypothetical protein